MAESKTPFHNPFAALGRLTGRGPDSPAAETPPPSPAPAAPPPPPAKGIPRAVVRIERSGRGGKAVTVVEHLDLTSTTRERWLKELKAALGCGGTIEDQALVFQGDQRPRLPALLTARGVKKITVA